MARGSEEHETAARCDGNRPPGSGGAGDQGRGEAANVLAVYVDDIIATGDNLRELWGHLEKYFAFEEPRPVKRFLDVVDTLVTCILILQPCMSVPVVSKVATARLLSCQF